MDKAINNLILEFINEVYVYDDPLKTHENVLLLLEKHGKHYRKKEEDDD